MDKMLFCECKYCALFQPPPHVQTHTTGCMLSGIALKPNTNIAKPNLAQTSLTFQVCHRKELLNILEEKHESGFSERHFKLSTHKDKKRNTREKNPKNVLLCICVSVK